MKKSLFVLVVAIGSVSSSAQAAFCRLIHDHETNRIRETSREDFELDIRMGGTDVASCKTFQKDNLKACWYQDSELKNFVFERLDAAQKTTSRIISKYDVNKNPLPFQLDIEFSPTNMFVVYCTEKYVPLN